MKNFLIPILMLLMLAACGGAGTNANPNPDTSEDTIVSDDPSASGFALLKSESESEPVIRHEGGLVRSALFRIPSSGGDAVEEAFDFFEKYKDILGITDPVAQLYLKKNRIDENGGEHLFFGIRKGDVSLEGILIGLNREGGFWTDLQSNIYLGGLEALDPLGITPEISVAEAENAAQKHLLLANSKISGGSKLVMYNTQIMDGENKLLLAYKVHVQGMNASGIFEEYFVYINAGNAAVVNSLPLSINAKDFDIETANGSDSNTCWFFVWESHTYWFNQDGPAGYPLPPSDLFTDGQNNFDDMHVIYDFYADTFNHRSWDGGDGDNTWTMVHTGVNWGNASFSPGCGVIKFGDGWATLDIAAHEFTHAVVHYGAGLVYQNQSGALDESFADVFAYFIDNDDDLIGDELTTRGPLRSMRNPPAFGQPDLMSNLCTPTNDYCAQAADSGGVHTNSGIVNKVAYLLLNGGTHNSVVVHSIDRSRMQKLWYDTLWNRIGTNTQLLDARDAFVAQVQSYVDRSLFGYSRRDVCEVRNAFFSVGLGSADLDCDGREDTVDTDDDNDFVLDTVDNCPTLSNPRQADLDGDGIGDACDIDQDGDGIWEDGDSSLSDSDNRCTEGVQSGCDDNCPTVANTDQTDSDGDGRGDVCDDEDGDGVFNVHDNCPNNANPLQANLDGDSRGDACDGDRDGDGRINDVDNCPDRPNASQSDSDGDGVGNACDNCTATSNADQSDIDGDGQGDACDNDDDGDGIADGDDSCPNDYDPNDTDLDNDGRGLVCDDGEAALLDGSEVAGLKDALLYFKNNAAFMRIPVRPCLGDGCPDWMPGNISLKVNFKVTDPQFSQTTQFNQMRLVDDKGIVVARDFATNGQLSLSAPLAADSHFMPPGGKAAGVKAFEGTKYFLEIAPLVDFNIQQIESLQVETQIEMSVEGLF